jgi:hypothetical protein
MRETERELQSAHTSRRVLKSELDTIRSDRSSVSRETRDGAAAVKDSAEPGTDGLHLRTPELALIGRGWEGRGAAVCVEGEEAGGAWLGEGSGREEEEGEDGGGTDAELMQLGRQQKERIESRLSAHGDPGPEFEMLLSEERPSETLGVTVLAFVLLLGFRPSSFSPEWSEVLFFSGQ